MSTDKSWKKIHDNKTIRPATLLKKRLWHRCFPVNFAKFFLTPFLTEHVQWLLLYQIAKTPQVDFVVPFLIFSTLNLIGTGKNDFLVCFNESSKSNRLFKVSSNEKNIRVWHH